MRNDPLKILVIGCGSIGRRHIRLLKEMGVRVAGIDTVREQSLQVSVEFGIVTYTDPDASKAIQYALTHCYDDDGEDSRWDGAIIATPNHLHADPTIAALAAGCGVLVEKPIATIPEAAHCMIAASEVNLESVKPEPKPLLVGYCLRYHPGLRRLKKLLDQGAIGTVRHASIHFGSYLPDWRPGFDYRQGYAARRETGGGILMDASHELDYACWLFGEPISVMAQVQNTGALEIETEDVADLVVRFESGVQANIHLDYLDEIYNRGIRIIGDNGTITWDFTENIVHHYSIHFNGHTQYRESCVPDDLYRAELQHFLSCIRGEEQPLVTGADGIRALRLVEAARRSSEEGRVVSCS